MQEVTTNTWVELILGWIIRCVLAQIFGWLSEQKSRRQVRTSHGISKSPEMSCLKFLGLLFAIGNVPAPTWSSDLPLLPSCLILGLLHPSLHSRSSRSSFQSTMNTPPPFMFFLTQYAQNLPKFPPLAQHQPVSQGGNACVALYQWHCSFWIQ